MNVLFFTGNNTLLLSVVIAVGILFLAVGFYDHNAKAMEQKDGSYELRVGYSYFLLIGILIFIVLIMSLGILGGIRQKEDMIFFHVLIAFLLLCVLIYRILELKNHRLLFNEVSISKTNLLNQTEEIKFEDLLSVKYSFWGYGSDLLFESTNGKKIKVVSRLNGFKTLVEFLKARNLLTP